MGVLISVVFTGHVCMYPLTVALSLINLLGLDTSFEFLTVNGVCRIRNATA